MSIEEFIKGIPKAELHLHIEGTFEPELMFKIAERNKVQLPYSSVNELKKAYNFNNLQEFLDIYYAGASVLLHEQDFYDMTRAYLEKIHTENVLHTEIFFDPQTHTERGIKFSTAIEGILRALEDGKREMGISYKLIMCFLRHLNEASAFKTLEEAMPYKNKIIGIGLDSSEVGNPPSKFERVFEKARKEGFIAVAHAGEEGPAEYVWEALNLLKIARMDHGNRSIDDEKLVQELVKRNMALTLCPLSNLKLQVIKDMKQHPLKKMMDKGIVATINSDDPAYFGGYMNDNFMAVATALDLSKKDIYQLCKNAFNASFADDSEKKTMLGKLENYYMANG